MKIIPYTSSHLQTVLDLFRLNTPYYFAPEEAEDLERYLNDEREDYFLAEMDGHIIGAGGINYGFEEGRAARISWDFIHPEQHRKGIGKMLLKYRIQKIKSNPTIQKIIVRTSQLAYPFYQKHGFRLIETTKDYWSEGLDLYLMEMDL